MNILTSKVEASRANEVDATNIQFGKSYSDHMLVADYIDGVWQTPQIIPYGNISISPATTFIHYGQSIFEGVKAYKNIHGEVAIFRPKDNNKRFNISAERLAMPHVPEEIFVGGMKELVALDSDWVPNQDGCSLYIRPFMFAIDEFIGVKPAEKFRFMIITSPAGQYYNKPTKIYVQDKYVRAFPGGIGFTKAAGNYAACMLPMLEVKALGYDQNLWTDGIEHKYIHEIGTMNVFFVLGDKVVTPDLSGGTILAGVTRDSVIKLLKEKGITVEERPITIDEIREYYYKGELKEAFGTGTAAVIAPIAELYYDGQTLELPPVDEWQISNWVAKHIADIRYGKVEDTHHWMMKVK
ncbi:MAG: branched-chain amino acid aminotransferase [Bacteroidetes bacterium]|jgi:branched-chain amino acid aminotransferase|nr:branched-chain amino acid aminotransferase [Bacteroidota bacterium]HQW46134.1 branched-chain amino acid aminotransferase [Chitinophagaceae bacterium]MBK7039873.1 branched-chain amino acid aminotransferase [Bacteroidota bacterium]MBK7589163.1 branched-chain amino acid aminotransferase [Bacteroidota bacterium]MBK8329977.1 branched-chain amino acid aminotransferase [Bacteroidota bacterium]